VPIYRVGTNIYATHLFHQGTRHGYTGGSRNTAGYGQTESCHIAQPSQILAVKSASPSRFPDSWWLEVAPPPSPPLEVIVAQSFPMAYILDASAKELTSKVSKEAGATIIETTKNFPLILIRQGKAGELQSYWIPISLEVDIMIVEPDGSKGTHPAIVLSDGVDVTVLFEIVIPKDFVSLSKAELILIPGGTGNLRRSVNTNFGKVGVGENYNQHTGNIPAGEVPVTLDKIEAIDVSDAFTGVAAEDVVGLEFTRHGSHANDTVDAACYLIAFRLIYS
jgi:hypothetical protein